MPTPDDALTPEDLHARIGALVIQLWVMEKQIAALAQRLAELTPKEPQP